MEHMEHNLSKYNILKPSQCFKDQLLGTKSAITIWCQKFKNLKIGSLFASYNSDPKIIFAFFFLIFGQFFWCRLKVGSLFGADNFEPKIIFLIFFLDFSHFLVLSKSWLIIRFSIFVIFLVLSKSWLIIRFSIFVIFLVYSKSWLIIRFRQF